MAGLHVPHANNKRDGQTTITLPCSARQIGQLDIKKKNKSQMGAWMRVHFVITVFAFHPPHSLFKPPPDRLKAKRVAAHTSTGARDNNRAPTYNQAGQPTQMSICG